MHFTVISGTNRPDNLSRKVAEVCVDMLAQSGHGADMLDMRDLPSDFVISYLMATPEGSFAKMQALVDRTTHFIFVAPEYNGSIPGILKLFIDACSYPDSFTGRKALLIGIAAGATGNEPGLAHLHDILTYCGTQVHPERLAIPRIRQRLKRDGSFADAETAQALHQLIQGYVAQEL